MKYKTLKHYNLPGHAHELTFSCFQKRNFLGSEIACKWLIESIMQSRVRLSFQVWAYVFMPSHVHLLLYPQASDYRISRILWSIKYPVTLHAISFYKRESPEFLGEMADGQPNGKISFRFWQRGAGYDRNLTSPDIIRSAIDYIHRNPVRKRLVERAEDWYWSSAACYAGKGNYPLGIDVGTLPF